MIFPIDLGELSVLFAVIAFILLITSELISPYHPRINLVLDRKRLRSIAILFSALFILAASMRALELLWAAL